MHTLIQKINNFDYAYEMSDDTKKYSICKGIEINIKKEIKQLNQVNKSKLRTLLNKQGKQNWKRYFN